MAWETGTSMVSTKRAVADVFDAIVQTLKESDKLSISGFGTFSVQQMPERMGRNPRTGAPVKIHAKKIIKFRPTVEIE